MNRTLTRALVLALVQAALVGLVGVVAVVDRARLPRAFVEVVPWSASPVEGRYMVGQVEMPASPDWKVPVAAGPGGYTPHAMADVTVRNGQLVAVPGRRYPVDAVTSGGAPVAPRVRLIQPVRLYLEAGAPSPFARGGSRWIEVSLPPKGLPRPIQLAARPQ